MNRNFAFISFILMFSVIFAACSPKQVEITSPSYAAVESDVLARLDVNNIYASIEELSKEPRVAGTGSERKAASFLMDQLKGYGYEVDVQKFDFERYIFPDSVEMSVEGFDGKLTPRPFKFTISGTVTGELIDAGKGLRSDFQNLDAKGKIALVTIADLYFSEIVLNAAEAGASAVIVYFPDDTSLENWSLGKAENAPIPAVTMTKEESSPLLDLIKNGDPVNGTITIKGARIEKTESQNLIATKQPDSNVSDDIVFLGAHYDSVDKAPGASDNASGTAVILEVARVLKDVGTNSEIRFLFFGAEEVGLIGSEKYVSAMTKDEIERSVAMFNLDMVGSADAGPLTVLTVDGMPNTVTKHSSDASMDLFGKALSIEFTNRSDHAPFHNVGIASAAFSYYPLEDWYHTQDDSIDKLSKDRLHNVAKIIAKSAFKLTFPDEAKK